MFCNLVEVYCVVLGGIPSVVQVDLSTNLQVFSYDSPLASSFYKNHGSIIMGN